MQESNIQRVDAPESEQFVRDLFRGILRREVDDAGVRHFVDLIGHGRSHAAIVKDFVESPEFQSITATKLFVPPGHFYSPIVNQEEARHHLARLKEKGLPSSIQGVALDHEYLSATWRALLPYMLSAPFPDAESREFRYAFINPAYSYGDGSVLHAMMRHLRPERYIEIGSGWTSACAVDTAERYLGGKVEFVFIEPYPDVLKKLIYKIPVACSIAILDKPVQEVPLELFRSLRAGDILFIDSTHVLRTGSDVCYELFEILPRLAKGVVVHFHDIFWPFEYPGSWTLEDNRSWNEIYALRAFLTDNPKWRIMMFNDYMCQMLGSLVYETYPRFFGNSGGAIWIEKIC